MAIFSTRVRFAFYALSQFLPVRRPIGIGTLLAAAVLRKPVQLQHKGIANIFQRHMANNNIFDLAAAIAGGLDVKPCASA
ncbi:hypothetical protein [Candidatus Pantoea persica]|uniref:hypothetical protein n=1 Tax=Candidatus Pantoea persica TaxID=2518128 RepID=UPI00215D87DB|nr:hypothetical protein [Candidatus Pantoea persica]